MTPDEFASSLEKAAVDLRGATGRAGAGTGRAERSPGHRDEAFCLGERQRLAGRLGGPVVLPRLAESGERRRRLGTDTGESVAAARSTAC